MRCRWLPASSASWASSFVHQDLGLVLELDRAREPARGRADRQPGDLDLLAQGARSRARELFARYSVDLDPRELVNELTPTERALLAIVRAVEEIREPQAQPRRCARPADPRRAHGVPPAGGHRAAVPTRPRHRDERRRERPVRVPRPRRGAPGHRSRDRPARRPPPGHRRDRDHDRGAAGRDDHRPALESLALAPQQLGGTEVDVTVHGPDRRRPRRTLDFDIRRGEILGITGLVGSGFDEVPYFLFGALNRTERAR